MTPDTEEFTGASIFFQQLVKKYGPWSKIFIHLLINRLHEAENTKRVLALSDDEEFKTKVHQAYDTLNKTIENLLHQYVCTNPEELSCLKDEYTQFLIKTNQLKPDNAFSH